MPRAKPSPRGDPAIAITWSHHTAAPSSDVLAYARAHGLTVAANFALDVITTDPAGPLVRSLIAVEELGAGLILSPTATVAATVAEAALLRRLAARAGARWCPLQPSTSWTDAEVEAVERVLRMHESLLFTPKIHVAKRSGASSRPGGPAPWGYRRGADGAWQADEAEQAALREVHARRADGASLDRIARWLNGLKLPGRGTAYRSTVRAILGRPSAPNTPAPEKAR